MKIVITQKTDMYSNNNNNNDIAIICCCAALISIANKGINGYFIQNNNALYNVRCI